MFLRLHLGPDFLNSPFWIDEEGCTENAVVLSAHEFLTPPDTVGIADFLILIRKQGERKVILCDKFIMLGHRVTAYAKQYGTCLLELSVFITERAGLLSSARRVIFWIEEQHDVAAFKIPQFHYSATTGFGLESRCSISFLELKLRYGRHYTR